MSFSSLVSGAIKSRGKESSPAHTRKESLEKVKGSLFIIEVSPRSATTVWIDGPMAKVYARYIKSYKGRDTIHYIFCTETGVRIALTEFELANVSLKPCSGEDVGDNIHLVPTRRARNYYVDYGQEEL